MEYVSSVKDFDDFVESGVWKDIQLELNTWLEMIRISLEDPNGNLTDKALHRLGGNAETIRKVLIMPEVVRKNIMASIEAKNNEEG